MPHPTPPLPPLRRDELRAAWAIFTPLLHAVDAGRLPLHPYPYGSRWAAAGGPATAQGGLAQR